MEIKKKHTKHKKSEIEKQYEEYFNYIPRMPPIQQPAPTEYLQTWVRYGVGPIEILGVKII